ncbi:MAG TPA: chromosome partitioning protein [Chromatiales bacterium]|nr:chromosome partitioning protein [Chromatiales bacterium]
MRHIMVLNPKGGCGKSTIATNLASYFAAEEDKAVALVDYDEQASSLDWLARRPDNRAEIVGVEGFRDGLKHVPRSADVAIIDAPARAHGPELTELVRHAETIIVPVLPSSIDIQALGKFLTEIRNVGKLQRKGAKLAVVANRVREYTLIFEELDDYLTRINVPYVAALREAQNYIRAYSRGLGVYELPEYLAWPDWEQWAPLVDWLNSKRSRP